VHPGDLRCSPGMSRWNTSASSRLEPSMTSFAIIGARAGLGAAVARRFGTEGFTVGLISRHRGHLDALAGELATTHTTQGFT
jgi:short-subunit dehydrogenase